MAGWLSSVPRIAFTSHQRTVCPRSSRWKRSKPGFSCGARIHSGSRLWMKRTASFSTSRRRRRCSVFQDSDPSPESGRTSTAGSRDRAGGTRPAGEPTPEDEKADLDRSSRTAATVRMPRRPRSLAAAGSRSPFLGPPPVSGGPIERTGRASGAQALRFRRRIQAAGIGTVRGAPPAGAHSYLPERTARSSISGTPASSSASMEARRRRSEARIPATAGSRASSPTRVQSSMRVDARSRGNRRQLLPDPLVLLLRERCFFADRLQEPPDAGGPQQLTGIFVLERVEGVVHDPDAGDPAEEFALRSGRETGFLRRRKCLPPGLDVHGRDETERPQFVLEPPARRPRAGRVGQNERPQVRGAVRRLGIPDAAAVSGDDRAEHLVHGIRRCQPQPAQELPRRRRLADRGADDGKIGGRRPGQKGRRRLPVGRADVAAVAQSDQRHPTHPGAGPTVFRKRLVEPPHPVVVLRLEEIGVETGEDGVRPHGPDPRLPEENLAELAGADGRDFPAEPPGALPTAEEGSELVPVEEFPQPPGAREARVLPGDPAAAEARQQRFRTQRRDRRGPQRREERAIREPLAAERQAVERGKIEQIVIPEPEERLVQQCADPGHQRRVPRVPGREVVPRQGGAERPLDPKGEPGAQGGREEGEEGSVGLGHRFHAAAPQSKRHLHLTLRGRRAGDGPREHQPGLHRLPLAVRFTAERHAARPAIEPFFLAQVKTRGSTVHLPLDDLDLAQDSRARGARRRTACRMTVPSSGDRSGNAKRSRQRRGRRAGAPPPGERNSRSRNPRRPSAPGAAR